MGQECWFCSSRQPQCREQCSAYRGLSINICWMNEAERGRALGRAIFIVFFGLSLVSVIISYCFCHDFVFKSLFRSSQFHFQILDSIVHLVGDEYTISENSPGSLYVGDSLVTHVPFKSTRLPPLSLARDQGRASGRGRLWEVGDHWGNKVSKPGCANWPGSF